MSPDRSRRGWARHVPPYEPDQDETGLQGDQGVAGLNEGSLLLPHVELDTSRQTIFVTCPPQLDSSTAPLFRSDVAGLFRLEWTRMALDFRSTTFFDSGGAGALLHLLKLARDAQRGVVLIVNPGPLLRIFDITGISRVFLVVDDPSQLA